MPTEIGSVVFYTVEELAKKFFVGDLAWAGHEQG